MGLDITIYKDRYISYDKINWEPYPEEVSKLNITHNLISMAEALGIYRKVWRPEENNIIYCKDMISHIQKAILLLKSDPEYYIKYNAPNQCGDITDMIIFLQEYYVICKKYPNCKIEASR
jgi:hypothetical protein